MIAAASAREESHPETKKSVPSGLVNPQANKENGLILSL